MRSLRQLFTMLCMGLMALFTLPAHAASFEELQSLQDGGYRITNQIFMYAILEKAGERRKDVNRLVAALDPRVAALGDKEASATWQALRSSVANDPYYNGEVAQQQLYTIEDNATRFTQALERLIPADTDPKKMAVHDLVKRMHIMMMIYLRNSADPMGGANYSGINSGISLENLPAEFTAKLAAVEKSQRAMAPAIAKIKPKWAFLSPRIASFNEKTVPYLVDIYCRQIIDLLMAATPN
ncbi:MAG: hypothetical protein ACRERR_15240 [Moraxellaceae bacterium]